MSEPAERPARGPAASYVLCVFLGAPALLLFVSVLGPGGALGALPILGLAAILVMLFRNGITGAVVALGILAVLYVVLMTTIADA